MRIHQKIHENCSGKLLKIRQKNKNRWKIMKMSVVFHLKNNGKNRWSDYKSSAPYVSSTWLIGPKPKVGWVSSTRFVYLTPKLATIDVIDITGRSDFKGRSFECHGCDSSIQAQMLLPWASSTSLVHSTPKVAVYFGYHLHHWSIRYEK